MKKSYLDSDDEDVEVKRPKPAVKTVPSWVGCGDTTSEEEESEVAEIAEVEKEPEKEPEIEESVEPQRESPPPGMELPERCFTELKCGSVDRYKREGKICEGGYGVVTKAKDTSTGRTVALKKIKFGTGQGHVEDGVHQSALREITTLLQMSHSNIVKVYEAVVGSEKDQIFLAMEYIEHDVRKLITDFKFKFTIPQVKCLMRQLLSGVGYLHQNWVIHRDLKTNNLLYGNNGVLKICDFGMARMYGSPIRTYTPLQWVLTLGFRPPEGLLGSAKYDSAVDIWGVGCIFAELLLNEPLFIPTTAPAEVNMLNLIFELIGSPTPESWPQFENLVRADPFVSRTGEHRNGLNIDTFRVRRSSPTLPSRFQSCLPPAGINLLSSLLVANPANRINASDAFKSAYFDEQPYPCSPCDMPQFMKK
eukprot:TRINITY_DN18931_c0_g1_i1.p1 TRINITY_DN18931_c0_g1~~TRINITY_DN18931_c0_g1_i1.p1  ORF type:complete len:420 (+),score=57.76 TRINITY_DN18931_c0_g1_i1:85-1344(+)